MSPNDALHAYLDSAEPNLEKNTTSYWLAAANHLDAQRLALVYETGILSVVDRQQVRQDVAGYILDVLLPAWKDAYRSAGSEDYANYVQRRVQQAQEVWTRDAIQGLEQAGGLLGSHFGADADPQMLTSLYGLASSDALLVARYEVQTTAKGLARRVVQYARQLLQARSKRIATFESAHARSAGEEAKARELYGEYGYKNVWRVDPESNVCARCMEMNGEEVEPGDSFSGGVEHAPLHPLCRCWTERVARTF